MSLIHLSFFYHLIESIPAEVEAATKEEVETEVGTTITEVDIEVDTMDMDVVGTADEVAVDTADMEIIVVGHIAGITGLDRKFTLPSNW